ncbi:murein hydrolase activator EnvC [Agromyces sp. Marseille-P2726]|uniref:murein hydrolase activator EnvC family protein n=1 Tax=Agromyces sp. Marseille-P2726 TaxID=2709132 RepID=UPI00156D599E|nr:M23 family metallopeptidase [Agromyces sp. Marseille-P2726]
MTTSPTTTVARARSGRRRHLAAASRVLAAVVVALVTIGSEATGAVAVSARPWNEPSHGDHDPQWSWPVPAPIRVVDPFRAPPTPYAAGHRGIDLRIEPGAVVVAAAPGTVSYAGQVAGRGVVAIDHGGGVVSAIEPVEASVAQGAPVAAGDAIAVVGSGGHCDARCVHFGVRVDGEYVSPFLFLGGLPRAVLLPMR